MHRVEPTRLQQLALQFAERAATFVENNEVTKFVHFTFFFLFFLFSRLNQNKIILAIV